MTLTRELRYFIDFVRLRSIALNTLALNLSKDKLINLRKYFPNGNEFKNSM